MLGNLPQKQILTKGKYWGLISILLWGYELSMLHIPKLRDHEKIYERGISEEFH